MLYHCVSCCDISLIPFPSQASSNCKVQISFNTFDSFGIYAHTQDQCYHWLEVKYTGDFGKAGPRYVSYTALKVCVLSKFTNNEVSLDILTEFIEFDAKNICHYSKGTWTCHLLC